MKKLYLLFPIIVIVFIMAGCKYANTRMATDEENKKVVDSISYVKDRDKDLCFATIKSLSYSGHEIVSITNVPFIKN